MGGIFHSSWNVPPCIIFNIILIGGKLMAKELRAGIIGCGAISKQKHMPALKTVKDVKLVAFCDLVEDRAKEAAKNFGEPDSKIYTDYRKLLEDKSIDFVHVLTGNRPHSEISVAALNADKHVMCEKPMAINYEEAKKMLDAYHAAHKRSGKLLTIGYQFRQNANYRYMKAAAERGDFGEIYYAKATAIRRRGVPNWGVFLDEYMQGGGPLIDIGTHSLDLTLWIMNNYKPKSVMGAVFKKLNENGDCGNIFGPWDPKENTVEDSAFGFITMENGAVINLEASWALNYVDIRESTTAICGTKGGADMYDGLRLNGDDFGRLYVTKPDMSRNSVAFIEGVSSGVPHEMEAQQWVHAIRTDTYPTVLPEQAIVVTQILEAIYKSGRSGQLVTF